MLRAFVKYAVVLAKLPQCLLFLTVKGGINILQSHLNCSTIVNWKTRKRTYTLKGSQRMGSGWIFLKTFRASLCMSLILAGSISLDSTFESINFVIYRSCIMFFHRHIVIFHGKWCSCVQQINFIALNKSWKDKQSASAIYTSSNIVTLVLQMKGWWESNIYVWFPFM